MKLIFLIFFVFFSPIGLSSFSLHPVEQRTLDFFEEETKRYEEIKATIENGSYFKFPFSRAEKCLLGSALVNGALSFLFIPIALSAPFEGDSPLEIDVGGITGTACFTAMELMWLGLNGLFGFLLKKQRNRDFLLWQRCALESCLINLSFLKQYQEILRDCLIFLKENRETEFFQKSFSYCQKLKREAKEDPFDKKDFALEVRVSVSQGGFLLTDEGLPSGTELPLLSYFLCDEFYDFEGFLEFVAKKRDT